MQFQIQEYAKSDIKFAAAKQITPAQNYEFTLSIEHASLLQHQHQYQFNLF